MKRHSTCRLIGATVLMATLIVLSGCTANIQSVSGLYSGILQDTDNHRLEGLLQLDPDMHYRYRTVDLSVDPVVWNLDEGTWYFEQGVIGLMRNGKKDLRFVVQGRILVTETAQAAFPELQAETLSLYRISD